ncbi:MAG: oligosaccharide flippase family protein [Patescibacteria group bacterium]
MIDKLKGIKGNKDLYETILVGTGTIIGSFFSYLLQFVLGRKLSVEDYGSFNTLLSLSSLIGVVSTVLGVSLVNVSTSLYVNEEKEKLKLLFINISKFSLLTGGVLFSIVFFSRYLISNLFKISNVNVVIFFAVGVGLAILNGVPPSFIRGLQKFKRFSLFQVLSCLNRFLFPTVLVFAGFGLVGVFKGLTISSTLTIILGFTLLGFNLKVGKKMDLTKEYKKILSFSLPVVLTHLFTTSLINTDLILVKKYFSPLEAGYYAGAVTLGKILLFGAGAVTIVMFPKVSALYAKKEDFYPRLKNLLIILTGVLLIGVFSYSVFPGLITRVFFGKSFENSVRYLPMFSIGVSLFVLVNFLTTFFLAIEKANVSLLLLPGVVLQYVLISIHHSSLYEVIGANIFACIITLALLVIYFYAQKSRWLKTSLTPKN